MRTAGPLTEAIRKLLDTNPNLTNAQVRPLLEKQGFTVAVQPPEKSEAMSLFDQYEYNADNQQSMLDVAQTCGFDAATTKAVLAEVAVRHAFKAESNNFNIVKYNWGKSRESGGSTKPVSSRNAKAKDAAVVGQPKPLERNGSGRGRKAIVPVVANDITDSLNLVKQNGGLAASQQRIAALRAEADALEVAATAVIDFQKVIADAA